MNDIKVEDNVSARYAVRVLTEISVRSRVIRMSPSPFFGGGVLFISKKIKGDKNDERKITKHQRRSIGTDSGSRCTEKLNDVKVRFLGKKGELTAVLKGMKDVAAEDRPKVGQLVNEAREEIETALNNAKTAMEKAIREAKLKEEVIDVTLPL